jgi:hypothetical protein
MSFCASMDASPALVNGARARASALDMDSLARASCADLEPVFRAAQPGSLESLSGHPRGRMLAVKGLDGASTAAVVRAFSASRWMLWEGKSFSASAGAREGAGINRIRFPTHRGIFPFRTYETASIIDAAPCIAIDYDVSSNPRIVRATYDEVREVAPGLFLGRGMRRVPQGKARFLLWFALDVRQQDVSVPFVLSP